jgi:hypothetical protein
MKYTAICLAVSLTMLQACAVQPQQSDTAPTVWSELVQQLTRDRRDAPWDPPPGRSLFEQLPPWDNEAERVCCGHLRECQPHQSPRC